jgi:hypothetical protein
MRQHAALLLCMAVWAASTAAVAQTFVELPVQQMQPDAPQSAEVLPTQGTNTLMSAALIFMKLSQLLVSPCCSNRVRYCFIRHISSSMGLMGAATAVYCSNSRDRLLGYPK